MIGMRPATSGRCGRRSKRAADCMNLPSFFRGLFFLPGAVGGKEPLNGDPSGSEAQFALGRRHDEANAPDFQQAMEWYRKAADQGHAAAQLNLGLMYASGRGVP